MHLKHLDGVRALAALYVLIHHILLQVDYEKSSYFHSLNIVFQYGRFAVDVFIVLSGFCLLIPLVNNNTINTPNNFLKRRATRILPTYYITIIFSLILIYTLIGRKTGSHWDACIPVTAWDIVTHLLLIQDLNGETAYKINHTLWSISVEWRIYLLFPLLIKLCQKFGIMLITFISLFVSFILWHTYPHIGLNPYTMSPHYLSLFMFGMLACYIAYTEQKPYVMVRKSHFCLTMLILATFISCTIFLGPHLLPGLNFSTLTTDYIIGTNFAILLLCMSSGKSTTLVSMTSWNPLVFIGTFAYSIYLVHAPVLQITSQYVVLPLDLSPNLKLLTMITLGMTFSLILSYIFFIVAEKPYMRKKPATIVLD